MMPYPASSRSSSDAMIVVHEALDCQGHALRRELTLPQSIRDPFAAAIEQASERGEGRKQRDDFLAEISVKREKLLAGFPADKEGRIGKTGTTPLHGWHQRQARHNLSLADLQQSPMKCEACLAFRCLQSAPVELRALEGFGVVRIGNAVRLSVTEVHEGLELVTAPLAHGIRQLSVEVGEEEEGSDLSVLFAHVDQRNLGIEQQDGREEFQFPRICEAGQPLAKGAVADLVVILQKGNEGVGWLPGAADPPLLPLPGQIGLPLVNESRRQSPHELLERILGEGRVVGAGFCGRDTVGGVMRIIVPVRREEQGVPPLVARMKRDDVPFIFGHQMDRAAEPFPYRPGHILQDWYLAAILDLVYRIETKAIEAKLLEPIERIVEEKGPNRGFLEADGCAPRGLPPGIEELRRIAADIVSVGAKVVIDHVEHHHQAALVGRVYEALQPGDPAIGGMGAVEQ